VNLANGDPEQEGVYSSSELLANAEACGSGDPLIAEMRQVWNARVVG
jgi:hypothetical protein